MRKYYHLKIAQRDKIFGTLINLSCEKIKGKNISTNCASKHGLRVKIQMFVCRI